MDSTSPVHEGFQEWNMSDARSHGDFARSRESKISPAFLKRTVDLIMQAMQGNECECAR
jgi:hypothetical protein